MEIANLPKNEFNANWKTVRYALTLNPLTSAAIYSSPGKSEIWKAIESQQYASEKYGQLESLGWFTFIAMLVCGSEFDSKYAMHKLITDRFRYKK